MAAIKTILSAKLREGSKWAEKLPGSSIYKPAQDIGLKQRTFYSLVDGRNKIQNVISHNDIECIFVIKDNKLQKITLDDFLDFYKDVAN